MTLPPFLGRGTGAWNPWEKSLFDPWLPISRLWDAMDLTIPTATSSFLRDAMAVANTRVDWKETPEAHVFTIDLPGKMSIIHLPPFRGFIMFRSSSFSQKIVAGLRKEDLKIDLVDQTTLRIIGERHKEEEEKTDQWHHVERSSGWFMRQFRLPKNVNVDSILAKLENWVLTMNAHKTHATVVM